MSDTETPRYRSEPATIVDILTIVGPLETFYLTKRCKAQRTARTLVYTFDDDAKTTVAVELSHVVSVRTHKGTVRHRLNPVPAGEAEWRQSIKAGPSRPSSAMEEPPRDSNVTAPPEGGYSGRVTES